LNNDTSLRERRTTAKETERVQPQAAFWQFTIYFLSTTLLKMKRGAENQLTKDSLSDDEEIQVM